MTENDPPQACEAAPCKTHNQLTSSQLTSSQLTSGLLGSDVGGESTAAGDTSPAVEGHNRLSIFGGWCRLLACLALLATAQQSFRYLGSPTATTNQRPFDQRLGAGPEVAPPQFMVDVNHAPQHELEALPEVGASLASRILAYRHTQGPFRQVDDLLQVRGVGPRTLEHLRPMLLVRPPQVPLAKNQ